MQLIISEGSVYMFNKEKPVEVLVNKEKCVKCGACLKICHDYLKLDENGYPSACSNEDKENWFGCIQCGNCMMLCPTGAIEVVGEDIDKNHLREIGAIADYETLNNLFLKRRSCRKFTPDDVSKEDLDRIINSAATAAVSIPPSEVKVLIVQGRDKVQKLADEILTGFGEFMKMKPLFLFFTWLLGKKTEYKMFKDFVFPLGKMMIDARKKGEDLLFYNAPSIMFFYGTENTDKEDMMIAATQATIAAEALGLGTCIIGSLGAVFQSNCKLRKKYGIEKTDKIGTGFIVGHPAIKFPKGFQRNFKEVRYYQEG